VGTSTSLVFIAAAIAGSSMAAVQGDRDNTLHVVLPRDAIPAISNPSFVPASEARLADDELVIGVVGEGEQRAYSTWQLDRHEIDNDTFEGRPIAVTW
jgi:hypothetical protein